MASHLQGLRQALRLVAVHHIRLRLVARAWIEPPDTAWGPLQILAGQLRRLGYGVDKAGAGDRWRLLLS